MNMRHKIIITLITLLTPLFSIAQDVSTIKLHKIEKLDFTVIFALIVAIIILIALFRLSWKVASFIVNLMGVECKNCGYTSRSSICPNCGKHIGFDKFGAKLSLACLFLFLLTYPIYTVLFLESNTQNSEQISQVESKEESNTQTSAQVQQIAPEKESNTQTSAQVLQVDPAQEATK